MSEFIFNATGSNDGPALQAALSAMTPADRLTVNGLAQVLPWSGMPTYVGPANAAMQTMLLLSNGILRCAPGASISSPAVPAACDLLCWQPPQNVLVQSPLIERLSVSVNGGRDAFVICTANNSQIQNPKIDHGALVTAGGSGYAFHILNDPQLNPNGGFFDAEIDGTIWAGGGRFESVGDGIEFHEVNATGPKCSIDISFVPGAASCRVINNSLTGHGGGLLMRNGQNVVVTGNSFEPSGNYDYASSGGRGYVCDIQNILGGAHIGDNVFSLTQPILNLSAYIYMLALSGAGGGEIEQNTFFANPGVLHPQGAAILLFGANAQVMVHQQIVHSTISALIYDPSNVANFIVPLAKWQRL